MSQTSHSDSPSASTERGHSRSREAWQLLKITCLEWWNDDTFRLAASLAFYTIFSLAPVLLIAVGVAGLVFSQETAASKIEGEVQSMVGADGAQAVRQVIDASKGFGSGVWTIVVGVGTLIVGATAVFGELQAALNKLWDVESEPKRGLILKLIMDRARSFALALGVGFLLLVSLVFSAVDQRHARLPHALDAKRAVALAGSKYRRLISRRGIAFRDDLPLSARRAAALAGCGGRARRQPRCSSLAANI